MGDSSLACSTTATSPASNSSRLNAAVRRPGTALPPPATTPSAKYSRCEVVCTYRNTAYSTIDTRPTASSWVGAKTGPSVVRVTTGRISDSAAIVPSTLSAEVAESSLKLCSWWCMPPTSRQPPTMPVSTIITVAYTVSRARVSVPGPPASISDTISVTSISVIASASRIDP